MTCFVKNALKSFAVVTSASLLFVIILTAFPLVASFSMNDFPIEQVVKDNFKLLIPLMIVSGIICPALGYASCLLIKNRFLFLLIIGIGGCWLVIITEMFIQSNFSLGWNDACTFLLLSVWAFFAYSFFSLPILIPAFLILERWTRVKK